MSKKSSRASESDWFRTHEKEIMEMAAKEREQRLRETAAKQAQEELDKLRTDQSTRERWLGFLPPTMRCFHGI